MPENRLINEKSPYLLQHAHDGVDWWPWCPEAFRRAEAEDKPVFLSIGYSTCHWCHVMGRETFADGEVVRRLNRAFLPVVVDREERPDVDAVYMAACQALTGSGGWPLSVLMTPAGEPFWAGTYLPARSSRGQPGLVELLDRVEELWRRDRQRLLRAGAALAAEMAREEEQPGVAPSRAALRRAVEQFQRSFDRVNGGFGGPPKFPVAHDLLFLLRYARLEEDPTALDMAERTLTQMARGGIFDQVGGGFCRYAADARWLIPHFEKMLNDNALLACAYAEAYGQTGRMFYADVARRTLDYALRELRLPGGGFACGQDADGGGEEGGYYLLTPVDVERALGARAAAGLCAWLGITADGNFSGRSVPNLLENADYARPYAGLGEQLRRLEAYRRERIDLHRDDKVLTGWNGLLIGALARVGRILGEGRYIRAAEDARIFLKTRLTTVEGRLLVRWRDGEAAGDGQLSDYAFLIWGLLELYAATFSAHVLRQALALAEVMLRDFRDEAAGGFFSTAHHAQRLIARPKETDDGAAPSGNAVAALVLVRLGKLTGRRDLQAAAEEQTAWLAGRLRGNPAGHSFGLLAMMEELYPAGTLVCAAAGAAVEGLGDLADRVHAVVKTPDNARALARLAPFTADYPLPAAGESYYLCRDGACAPPVGDRELLEELLRQ